MDFRFVPPDLRHLDEASAELVACTVWQEERPLSGLAGLLDWRLAGRLSKLVRDGFLKGELGEVMFLPGRPRLPFDKVLLLGLGIRTSFDDDVFRQATKSLMRSLEGMRVRRAVVELPGRAGDLMEAERAAELVIECIGDSVAHDAWVLVEGAEAQKKMTRAQDERRRNRRG
jgi:hypothetical protein